MRQDKALLTFKLAAVLCILALVACLATEAVAAAYNTRMVTAHGGLNVRREPRLDSPVVYLLSETEVVIVLAFRNGWALVSKNSSPGTPIGWSCADYLK